jgi:hypothetical protein
VDRRSAVALPAVHSRPVLSPVLRRFWEASFTASGERSSRFPGSPGSRTSTATTPASRSASATSVTWSAK